MVLLDGQDLAADPQFGLPRVLVNAGGVRSHFADRAVEELTRGTPITGLNEGKIRLPDQTRRQILSKLVPRKIVERGFVGALTRQTSVNRFLGLQGFVDGLDIDLTGEFRLLK